MLVLVRTTYVVVLVVYSDQTLTTIRVKKCKYSVAAVENTDTLTTPNF
jgi:hypothetical protein